MVELPSVFVVVVVLLPSFLTTSVVVLPSGFVVVLTLRGVLSTNVVLTVLPSGFVTVTCEVLLAAVAVCIALLTAVVAAAAACSADIPLSKAFLIALSYVTLTVCCTSGGKVDTSTIKASGGRFSKAGRFMSMSSSFIGVFGGAVGGT